MLRILIAISLISLLPAQRRHEQQQPAPDIPKLLRMLTTGTSSERISAAMRLGLARAKRAVPALTTNLRYPDPKVQNEVLVALNNLGAVSAVPEIRRLLHSSTKGLRVLAALTLLYFEDHASQKAILELLRNDDVEIRQQMTQLFRLLPLREAAPDLEACLEDEDLIVRLNAIVALGTIGLPSSEAKLAVFLEGDEERSRAAAFTAVTNIAPANYQEKLREDFHSGDDTARRLAITPLTRIQDRDVEEMLLEEVPAAAILNFFNEPEACEKMRATRVMLREVRDLNLEQIAELVSKKTGMPVKFSPSLPGDPRLIRVRGNLGRVLGYLPETFALLSTLDPTWWEGIPEPISWTIEEGEIRIVSSDEAETFFREKALQRKDGR
jgi:HEAT repeat protein